MHLRSVTLKGFKSFPFRTKLEFGPGISVIVGPNGSGKSNITDAVLWALGEQSPLAVRGQTMRDVLFAGGPGVPSAPVAEVEVVLDNSDGRLGSDFSEIAILRRLDRSGEGEYRINGARCRLVDVLEVLSDTGLGKEMHSVVSQGKVEQIVLSRPRDRRRVIEEAAGLGKHRKRRHRAQLKLERTRANLERLLDVEREARSRLRPLRRQAEAAELHERLERQQLEVRYELLRDELRAAEERHRLASAQAEAAEASLRELEQELATVTEERGRCEQELAARARERERLRAASHALAAAADRVAVRAEVAVERARAASERRERRAARRAALERELNEAAASTAEQSMRERIAALERELEVLERRREQRRRELLEELEWERERALAAVAAAQRAFEAAQQARREASAVAESIRARVREGERALAAARRESARIGSELAAANQFLARAGAPVAGLPSLLSGIGCEPGYERALAAALGPALSAGVAASLEQAVEIVAGEGARGGEVVVVPERARGRQPTVRPPAAAQRLREHVQLHGAPAALVDGALADVWVFESLEDVPADFDGLAVTREGLSLDPRTGAVARVTPGGVERVLEERRRRDQLVCAAEAAAEREHAAAAALESLLRELEAAENERDAADERLREQDRQRSVAQEQLRRVEWTLEERRRSPDEGPDAVRRAEVVAELRSLRADLERRQAEQQRMRAESSELRAAIAADDRTVSAAERAARALRELAEALRAAAGRIDAELRRGEGGETDHAARLRALAARESELQRRLRAASEDLTAARVARERARDAHELAATQLESVASRLGLPSTPRDLPLSEDERSELGARLERLVRRREQLGPVNPLAKQEYEDALRHVEELERQRRDLEDAVAELDRVIAETDRLIKEGFKETFEAAARNFEEVVAHLFPGGRGRLRLVDENATLRPLPDSTGEEPSPSTDDGSGEEAVEPGIEVEVTPAGKTTRRLSLLSGGEKSLVALAFLMAVFLARPCPFYILDEVEAALDDVNIERFLALLRRYADRAQFIVVTHQKRTMDAADTLYGVSMGRDGVSRVVSRRLAGRPAESAAA